MVFCSQRSVLSIWGFTSWEVDSEYSNQVNITCAIIGCFLIQGRTRQDNQGRILFSWESMSRLE